MSCRVMIIQGLAGEECILPYSLVFFNIVCNNVFVKNCWKRLTALYADDMMTCEPGAREGQKVGWGGVMSGSSTKRHLSTSGLDVRVLPLLAPLLLLPLALLAFAPLLMGVGLSSTSESPNDSSTPLCPARFHSRSDSTGLKCIFKTKT